MFPLELSDGVFSLMDGEVHSTVTFVATLAADGALQECEVQAGRVRCSRITYDAADACLAGRSPPDSPEILDTLRVRHRPLPLHPSWTLAASLMRRPRRCGREAPPFRDVHAMAAEQRRCISPHCCTHACGPSG